MANVNRIKVGNAIFWLDINADDWGQDYESSERAAELLEKEISKLSQSTVEAWATWLKAIENGERDAGPIPCPNEIACGQFFASRKERAAVLAVENCVGKVWNRKEFDWVTSYGHNLIPCLAPTR